MIVIMPVVLFCTFNPSLLPALLPDVVIRILRSWGLFLYILARVSLIGLAFTTLRKLPSDAFVEVDWTKYIPHI